VWRTEIKTFSFLPYSVVPTFREREINRRRPGSGAEGCRRGFGCFHSAIPNQEVPLQPREEIICGNMEEYRQTLGLTSTISASASSTQTEGSEGNFPSHSQADRESFEVGCITRLTRTRAPFLKHLRFSPVGAISTFTLVPSSQAQCSHARLPRPQNPSKSPMPESSSNSTTPPDMYIHRYIPPLYIVTISGISTKLSYTFC